MFASLLPESVCCGPHRSGSGSPLAECPEREAAWAPHEEPGSGTLPGIRVEPAVSPAELSLTAVLGVQESQVQRSVLEEERGV